MMNKFDFIQIFTEIPVVSWEEGRIEYKFAPFRSLVFTPVYEKSQGVYSQKN